MSWTTRDDMKLLSDREYERTGNRFAYFTLATAGFEPGLIVLKACLQKVSNIPLVAMCTSDVDLSLLENSGIDPVLIEEIDNPAINKSKRFFRTYTKLRVFEFDEWERIVFLDSDMLVFSSVDELFAQPGAFCAAPDLGIELHYERFNSGMMVLKPSRDVFAAMLSQVGVLPSYDGSDQGFLNSFFADQWTVLPKEYNLLVRLFEFHPNECEFAAIKILHYVGAKPWILGELKEVYRPLFQHWYDRVPAELARTLLEQWMVSYQTRLEEYPDRKSHKQKAPGLFQALFRRFQ